MTKIVGLTGGIGSGKTTVAEMFKSFGVPVYNADEEAKILMQNSEAIKHELIDLLGESCYTNGQLNRSFIASQVFADQRLLQKINAIVHPKVAAHFEEWFPTNMLPMLSKKSPFFLKPNLNTFLILLSQLQHLLKPVFSG